MRLNELKNNRIIYYDKEQFEKLIRLRKDNRLDKHLELKNSYYFSVNCLAESEHKVVSLLASHIVGDLTINDIVIEKHGLTRSELLYCIEQYGPQNNDNVYPLTENLLDRLRLFLAESKWYKINLNKEIYKKVKVSATNRDCDIGKYVSYLIKLALENEWAIPDDKK